jgi:hypothetical protein
MPIRILGPRVRLDILRLVRLERSRERVPGRNVAERLAAVPHGRHDVKHGSVDLPCDAPENVEAGKDVVERVGFRRLAKVQQLLVRVLCAHDLSWFDERTHAASATKTKNHKNQHEQTSVLLWTR